MGIIGAKTHELLSRAALLPLWKFQRVARPSRRTAALHYFSALNFRRRAAQWDTEQKRAWILERLRFAVRRAARETSYYARLFEHTGFDPLSDFDFDEFARLPMLERDEVRRAGLELVSQSVPRSLLRKDATGGSTGSPTEIWLGPEETGWRESAIEYSLEQVGVPTGAATAFFWGHHLDPIARESLLERYHDFEANVRWFDCFRLSPEVLEGYHREFERWRPACIIAYAGALAALAEHLMARGLRPNYPRVALVTGAEKLWPGQREIIEKIFGRPVHERYGSRDAGLIGFQFAPGRTHNYEIDWANVLLEPDGRGHEAGILITKLHADGMPLLRYRIGDVARFPEGSEPGHPVFVLHEVLGRDLDRIWLPDGRWVHPIQFPHMIKDYPVREFMFVQRPDYSVELRIVPRDGFAEETRGAILSTVSSNMPGVDVSVMLVEEIPRTKSNKWRPVISQVGQSERGNSESGA
jgi:phenylacetate-CoA ligase